MAAALELAVVTIGRLQESKTFTVSGSPRVNVSTFDGSVQVHGWDKSEVMYTATTRGDEEGDLKKVAIQNRANRI